MTPTAGSRGPTDPVIRISLGSVPCSQPRRAGSVQTNLFGRTPDDPAARFCRHMRQLADELRAETSEDRRISEDEDDPVTGNPVEETAYLGCTTYSRYNSLPLVVPRVGAESAFAARDAATTFDHENDGSAARLFCSLCNGISSFGISTYQ